MMLKYLIDECANSYIEYCKNDANTVIEKVIFNNPATIVFWSDGTKTVVKCSENDVYDPEKGLAMAVAKKFLGTNKSHSNYMNVFKKWLPKEEEMSDSFEDFRDSLIKNLVMNSYDPFEYFKDSLKNLAEIDSKFKGGRK